MCQVGGWTPAPTTPSRIYEIDPFAWEEIIAGAYKEAGFDEVILTPRSGDKGRDVIATKRDIVTIRVIDQVKAYSPNRRVTPFQQRSIAKTSASYMKPAFALLPPCGRVGIGR